MAARCPLPCPPPDSRQPSGRSNTSTDTARHRSIHSVPNQRGQSSDRVHDPAAGVAVAVGGPHPSAFTSASSTTSSRQPAKALLTIRWENPQRVDANGVEDVDALARRFFGADSAGDGTAQAAEAVGVEQRPGHCRSHHLKLSPGAARMWCAWPRTAMPATSPHPTCRRRSAHTSSSACTNRFPQHGRGRSQLDEQSRPDGPVIARSPHSDHRWSRHVLAPCAPPATPPSRARSGGPDGRRRSSTPVVDDVPAAKVLLRRGRRREQPADNANRLTREARVDDHGLGAVIASCASRRFTLAWVTGIQAAAAPAEPLSHKC